VAPADIRMMRFSMPAMMPADSAMDNGGRPTQALDIVMLGKKISELSTSELMELNSRLVSGIAGEVEQQPTEGKLN
jgi:hypothetical protein